MAAQPQVAVVVGVGLVRAGVLAAVELDDDPPCAPDAVDDVRAERLVALGQLDLVADQQRPEAPLEVALGLAVARGVGIEGGFRLLNRDEREGLEKRCAELRAKGLGTTTIARRLGVRPWMVTALTPSP